MLIYPLEFSMKITILQSLPFLLLTAADALGLQNISDNASPEPSNLIQVAAMSALVHLDHTKHPTVFLSGYYRVNDGGGGLFYWDPLSVEATNRGTILQS